MTIAMRTSVAISSGGISAQLIRLLPPAGCPGEAVWVPSNEVQRWEQLGFGRAPIPAADLELSWQPAGAESGGLIPIELLLNPRTTPPNAVTVDWGDGVSETLPWPVGGDGNGRLQHGYASRSDYTITTELTSSGVTATLLVSLAGCPIWSPEPPAPGPGPNPAPGSVLPLIPGAGLSGAAYDGSTTQQWRLTPWSGGSSAGGVPPSDGSSALFLCADGTWAMPPGGNGGTQWFNGAGPPPLTISGANPGDYYLDNLSGNFYVLEG
ncbi:hypothetical protein KBY72_07135 [Cyanobium sp. BA5m-21]|uniref:hypothetical protein n=1 Tax=Cyanobium sp. BA5m-21 TaxID=2823706 RepID=UPI0020CBB560|nr:hypothetical protein [Cyanobium sp. BA5m-21]MCP9906953.1 hypothetical protein [Cyanobium sp. BA5m-21]